MAPNSKGLLHRSQGDVERLVEEVLLGKVVERFSIDVRTQSLRGVIIDDDDHKQVFLGDEKCL